MTLKRPLVLCRSGVHPKLRHFSKELMTLMPNAVKTSKFVGTEFIQLNFIADEKNCTSIVLFDSKTAEEYYIWISRAQTGPTICFYIELLHPIQEINPTGASIPNSLLVFDSKFDENPTMKTAKELLTGCFSFSLNTWNKFSSVISFYFLDDRIWMRRYQIIEGTNEMKLLEAGPRLCLRPVAILSGSFGGIKIWKNPRIAGSKSMRKKKDSEK